MEQEHLTLDPETVRALVRLVEENALTELSLEGEGFGITLKAEGAAQWMAATATDTAELPDHEESGPRLRVSAPMTGVFYRAPAPGEPPCIEVGDVVEVGQVIGLIEAMKVFSEVPAEVAGRVVEIPVKNGELVHQEDTLVVLEPLEEGHGE